MALTVQMRSDDPMSPNTREDNICELLGYEQSAKRKLAAMNKCIRQSDQAANPSLASLAAAALKTMPGHYMSTWPLIGPLISYFFRPIDQAILFTHDSDTRPAQFPEFKSVDTQGSVANVALIWDTAAVRRSNYTGVYLEDQHDAIVRLGLSTTPLGMKISGYTCTWGIGLKVLRDGRSSADTVAKYTFWEQVFSANPFENTMCTDSSPRTFQEGLSETFPDFRAACVLDTISRAADIVSPHKTPVSYQSAVGLSDWADDHHFPFVMCFRPGQEVRRYCAQHLEMLGKSMDCTTSESHRQVHEMLSTIKPGTVLFDIFASTKPSEMPLKIGEMKLADPFRTSSWGDKQLFFKHTFLEEGLELRPEWKSDVSQESFWFNEGADRRYKVFQA